MWVRACYTFMKLENFVSVVVINNSHIEILQRQKARKMHMHYVFLSHSSTTTKSTTMLLLFSVFEISQILRNIKRKRIINKHQNKSEMHFLIILLFRFCSDANVLVL